MTPWDGQTLTMGAEKKIRVFILDDHEIVRRGLRELLTAEDDIEVIGESGTAAEALDLIPALRPDVALLDARLSDGSGIEVCRVVRSGDPHIQVLIITGYDDDEALFSAIVAGAQGYVLKQINGSDLIGGVRLLAAGQSLIDPQLTAKVLDRVRSGAVRGARRAPGAAVLNDRERKVLRLIALGMTNRQIGAELYLGDTTVKNCVSRILAKLGLERRAQAAVLAELYRD